MLYALLYAVIRSVIRCYTLRYTLWIWPFYPCFIAKYALLYALLYGVIRFVIRCYTLLYGVIRFVIRCYTLSPTQRAYIYANIQWCRPRGRIYTLIYAVERYDEPHVHTVSRVWTCNLVHHFSLPGASRPPHPPSKVLHGGLGT